MTIVGAFVYILLWGSMDDLRMKGYEDRAVASLCEDASKIERGGYQILKVTRYSPGSVYAVICNTPRCAEPENRVDVERFTCERVQESRRFVVEPERWELRGVKP